MPKKTKLYSYSTKRMGGIHTGIVKASTKTIALKKIKRRKILRHAKIKLKLA